MKEWFPRENRKRFGMDKLAVCLLIGVALLVICIPADSRKDGDGEESEQEETRAEAETLEGRLTAILEQIEGVGQVEVMLTVTGDDQTVEGVLVVAQGADSPQVRQEIIETAQALFPVAAHKIKVCKAAETSGGVK